MRRLVPIIVITLLTSLAAVVGSNGVGGAGAGPAHVHLVHTAAVGLGGPAAPVDVYVNDALAVDAFAYGETIDLEVSPGNQTVVVMSGEADPPEALADHGGTELGGGSSPVSPGGAYTFLLTPGLGAPPPNQVGLQTFENDVSPIDQGIGRLTFNHGATPLLGLGDPDVTVTIGDETIGPLKYGDGGTVELPELPNDGTYDLVVEITGLGAQDPVPVKIVGGVYLIVTLISGTAAAPPEDAVDSSVEVLFLEQILPDADPQVEAFCAALPELSALGGEVTEAIDAIDTDAVDEENEAQIATWQALVAEIEAVLAAGDASTAAEVDDEWLLVTDGLRTLVAAVKLVDYDFTTPEGQTVADELQAASDEPADPEVEAATATLTEWFVSNCVPAGAAPPAPAATPTGATPTFTG